MKSRPKTYFDQSKEANEEIEKTINYLPVKISRQAAKEQTRSTDGVFVRKGSKQQLSIISPEDLADGTKFEEKKLTCQYNDKPIVLNSYSSIYKQQRENSKSSARDEIVTSERYKEKDVVNQVPVTTLRNSSSMGEVKNKHK